MTLHGDIQIILIHHHKNLYIFRIFGLKSFEQNVTPSCNLIVNFLRTTILLAEREKKLIEKRKIPSGPFIRHATDYCFWSKQKVMYRFVDETKGSI
jgi:hypothetical protein